MVLTEELRVEGELLHGQHVGTVLDRGIAQPAIYIHKHKITNLGFTSMRLKILGNSLPHFNKPFDVSISDSEKK